MYADFECNLKSVESYEGSYSKKYQDHVPCSFPCKIVCVDDKFTKPIVVFRGKNAAYGFVKPFNKYLIIREEEEKFQSSNTYWICGRLIDSGDENVRDHFHVTGKFRGAAHWSCNMNLHLTKNVPVIFHNLRDYDSHLIFCDLNKFNVKIDVIPNRLENTWHFFIKKHLVFIYPYEYMDNFKGFNEEQFPDEKCLYSSLKDEADDDNGKN